MFPHVVLLKRSHKEFVQLPETPAFSTEYLFLLLAFTYQECVMDEQTTNTKPH